MLAFNLSQIMIKEVFVLERFIKSFDNHLNYQVYINYVFETERKNCADKKDEKQENGVESIVRTKARILTCTSE